MKVIRTVPAEQPKRCVPHMITWNWFFNRRPRGRK